MKILLTIATLLSGLALRAQNVGIGTTEPTNRLQINGNLVATAPITKTNTPPTVAQEKTVVNGTTVTFLSTDSTGRIYDPGGPLGNYLPNLLGYANINIASLSTGIELIAESMQLGTGDSLIIKETSSATTILLAVGNGYTNLGRWIFNTNRLHITFKSNADANTGSGFTLLFKRLYDNSGSLQNVNGYAGNSLFFDTKSGVFRAGSVAGFNFGNFSAALGDNNIASGTNAFAMGASNEASGISATAIGSFNDATGDYSVALGSSALASGIASVGLGAATNATGDYATAMGRAVTASGDYATAMGSNTRASATYATSMGRYTDATGYAATALGDSTLASGLVSFASGFRSTAGGIYAVALGYIATANGNNATALGNNTLASGINATAMGLGTVASGQVSTAIGNNTTASGLYSTAMGTNTQAIGRNSTAMGESTIADGNESTAMGYFTTASGDRSTAIGSYVSTNNQIGSLIIGDYSTSTILNSAGINSFRARFDGGYRFYTSSDLTTSCALSAGSNAWSTTSDRRLKENFDPVNGEDFLHKIALMPLSSWNYKQQNPQVFRHYGPMAQDFYAAFGKDRYGTIGNDTTINSADFDGVNLIAIQALEKRTQKILQLEQENAQLKKEQAELKARLEKLEAALLKQEN